jgi:hypothetical protein
MTAAGARAGGLTPAELRLVEEYVWVLDFVSRCALGVDRGDWFYLYDKAGELQRAAGQLAELAYEAYQAHTRGRGPRPEAVRAAVAWHGRHYRAGRLLHPANKPRGRR